MYSSGSESVEKDIITIEEGDQGAPQSVRIWSKVDTMPGMGILMGSRITYATKQVSWLKRLQRPMDVKVRTVPQGIILKVGCGGRRTGIKPLGGEYPGQAGQ